MRIAFESEVTRQRCLRVERLPWILEIYRRPFERYSSIGRQALFGAPNFVLFLLFQRLWPFRTEGVLTYLNRGQEHRIRFNAKNSQFRALYLSAFSQGYEPQTTALINLLTPADGVFYDIGSNWGWFCLSLAARPDFAGTIHAFEPFPTSFEDLQSVVNQAGLASRIQSHNVALGERCGSGTMHLPDHISSGAAVLDDTAPAGGSGIPIATLDSLTLAPPSLMKVDVEGNEAKVFRGGANLLAKHKPMIVFENFLVHSNAAGALEPLLFLSSLGYDLFRPAWLKQTAQTAYYLGDDQDENPQPTETLALAQFETPERFLLPDALNIFACHRDRLGELEKRFKKA